MIVKPVVKYKVGMKVKVKDTLNMRSTHNINPEYYPCPGTTGIIKRLRFVAKSQVCLLVQWELGSTSGNDRWCILASDVEVVT